MADRGGIPPAGSPLWELHGYTPYIPNPNLPSVDPGYHYFDYGGMYPEFCGAPEIVPCCWPGDNVSFLSTDIYHGNNWNASHCVENSATLCNNSKVSEGVEHHRYNPFKPSGSLGKDTTSYNTSSRVSNSGVNPMNEFGSKSFLKFPQEDASVSYDYEMFPHLSSSMPKQFSYSWAEGNSSYTPQLNLCSSLPPCEANPNSAKLNGYDASRRVSEHIIGTYMDPFPCFKDLSQNSANLVDQTVDSPCWKGPSSSHQSPSVFGEEFTPNKLLSHSEVCNQFIDPPFFEGPSSYHQSPFLFGEESTPNKHTFHSEGCGHCHKLLPATSGFSETSHIEKQNSNTCKIEVTKHKKVEPGVQDDEEKEMGQEDKYSQATVAGTSDSSSAFGAKSSVLNCIMGELQNLSKLLLSPDVDATQLKDDDHELLESVIDNLKTFAIKNKKDIQISGMKSDCDTNISNVEQDSYCEIDDKFHCINTNIKDGERHNFGLNDAGYTAQTFQKILQKKLSNDEKNLDAQVYKKLWIDAEAALCSMKYEFQVAQMKNEAENRNYQTKGKMQRLSSHLDIHGKHETSETFKQLSRDASRTSKHEQDISLRVEDRKPSTLMGDTYINALDMAAEQGFVAHGILQGRDDWEGYMNTDKQPEDSMGSDAHVMARLQILKGRDDIHNSVIAEKQPEKSFSKEAVTGRMDIDAHIMARLKVLRGRGDGESPMSTEKQPEKSLPDKAPTNVKDNTGADAQVMARILVLKGRDDEKQFEKSLPLEAPASVMVRTNSNVHVLAKLGVLQGPGDGQCRMSSTQSSDANDGEISVEWEHVLYDDHLF